MSPPQTVQAGGRPAHGRGQVGDHDVHAGGPGRSHDVAGIGVGTAADVSGKLRSRPPAWHKVAQRPGGQLKLSPVAAVARPPTVQEPPPARAYHRRTRSSPRAHAELGTGARTVDISRHWSRTVMTLYDKCSVRN